MRRLIRGAFRLIAQWWEMIKEHDERVVHDHFVASVARRMDALHWRRTELIKEIGDVAYRNVTGPTVCGSAHSRELSAAQRRLQRVDGRIERLERQIDVHAVLCERSLYGRTQRELGLH